jgi:HSP20 family protein
MHFHYYHTLIQSALFLKQTWKFIPDQYVYSINVPGVKKEDLTVSITDNLVTVKGKREKSASETKPNYKYAESIYGSFTRTFNVEDDTLLETLNVTLNDEVLKLTIDMKPDTKPSMRNIEIE